MVMHLLKCAYLRSVSIDSTIALSITPRNIMIVITGASGQLGQHVIAELLKKTAASNIVAAVRNVAKARHLAALGVQVREADYGRPETLDSAFRGAEKILLISSSEVGQRVPQHRNVIDAAKRAGVKLIAYTSVLRAIRRCSDWPTNTAPPRRISAPRACRTRCCAMAGIWRITRNIWSRCWPTARCSARPARGASRPPRAPITRPPPPRY